MKKTIFTLMLLCCCLAGCGDGTAWLATGVAPEATVMCIKSAGEEGSAGAVNIVKGMEWAVEHGCDLISLSLGVAKAEIADKELLRHTCDALLDAGIVVIGAVDENDTTATFTSHGPVTWQDTEFSDYAYEPGIYIIQHIEGNKVKTQKVLIR